MERNSTFELGQWVQIDGGVGQVLYVRPIHVEKYSSEYFDGKKLGEFLHDVVVAKMLCDFSGKIRKKNRMTWFNANYVNSADDQDIAVVRKIKTESPDEYRNYVVYDERRTVGISTEIHFTVNHEVIPDLTNRLQSIAASLPNTFTLKEYVVFLKENQFPLDFDQARKFVPGTGLNFTIILFCPMLRVVGKQFIYTKSWCSAK